jgi:hypothetical protein
VSARLGRWTPPPADAIVLSDLPVTGQGRTVWTCSACGRRSTWKKGWVWNGSYLDLDNGFVRRVCCPKCAPSVGEGPS